MTKRQCKVEGCERKPYGLTYCLAHLSRFKRYGSPTSGRAMVGDGLKFIAALDRDDDSPECIHWPWGIKDYPQTTVDGKVVIVSRLLCEQMYGPPPTAAHQAAHSCGNGHLGCVKPKHLRWATPAENGADIRKHGTQRGERNAFAKLTDAQVEEIRRIGRSQRQWMTAKQFGISQTHVSSILKGVRHTHALPSPPQKARDQ